MSTQELTTQPAHLNSQIGAGPFDLNNDARYQKWRAARLANAPKSAAEIMVPISDLAHPSSSERAAIIGACRRANMAIYDCGTRAGDELETRSKLRAFMAAFGLQNLESHRSAADDGIVALEVAETGTRKGYIPYTNRPLSWHTDGYYNAADARIHAMVLHCVRDAASGGENALLDPEIAYIRVRDHSRDLISALMHEDCLTIPSNVEPNGTVRPASVGPVFYVDPLSGALQMRYSARTRNIIWRDNDDTRAAAKFLTDLVAQGEDVITHRLAPGQGLISNNVLHNRSGFCEHDSGKPGRLYYRSRFRDRIGGT